MLFNTQDFKLRSNKEFFNNVVNQDILLVDMDNTQIKRLVAPKQKDVLLWPNKAFHLSPNGKLVAVQKQDHIDVIGINGEQIHERVVTYLPNWINEWILLSWSPDSSQLMILPPILGNTDPIDGPDLRTIRQYPIDGSTMTEIQLRPEPMADYFALSPSGSWIVYNYYYYAGKTDKTIPDGVYIGNLAKGSSRQLDLKGSSLRPFSFAWGPDDKHFMLHFADRAEMYLGNTEGDITPLSSGRFIGWVDHNRYIFYTNGAVIMMEIGQEMGVLVVDLPQHLKEQQATYLTYHYPQNK